MQIMTEDFINLFKLISHSEPNRKLIVHLSEVYIKAKKRFSQLAISFEKLSLTKVDFEKLLEIVVFCHDFGKSSTFFQKKILYGLEKNKENEEQKLSEHGLVSAFFGYFIATEKFNFDKKFAGFVFMAIRYHHLDLQNADIMQTLTKEEIRKVLNIFQGIKQNSDEINRIYKYFLDIENVLESFESFLVSNFSEREIAKKVKYFKYKDDYLDNDIFIFMILFSLLIYSDKEDAIFRDRNLEKIGELSISSKSVEKFKSNYFKTREITPLDEIREKIYQNIVDTFNSNDKLNNPIKNNDVFFVKLPTGAGKTLLLYKLAMQIKEERKNVKVFYLLPFITLIEQNATILKELLNFMNIDTEDNRIFLEKHSLSGEFVIENGSEEYDIDKKQFLLDTLESEFVVTSFHQLFYGVFKRKNALLKRFHQFANSIILIDEVQLIPLKLMYTLTQFLKFMSEIFNCKIIVASATFPNIARELLTNSHMFDSIEKILTKEENNKFFNRYEITLDFEEVYSYETLENKIDEKINTKKDLLFRVNTINSANRIYDYVTSLNSSFYKKENIFLLTSAIPPINRKRIIDKVKENIKNGIKQIVIATQLIQAGVDISLEDGFEELAPLDLIIQSMGRRNRSAEKVEIGRADIIKIKNEKGFEGHKIYNNCDIAETIKILESYQTLTEQEIYFHELLDKYYNSQVEIKLIDKYSEKLEFESIDNDFVLIENAPLSFSFFMPLGTKAKNLWQKLVELDVRKKDIKKDKDFWKNIKEIEGEFSKIKKDISLYIVNQNFYYIGGKKEIAFNTINQNFDSALGIYLATDEIMDGKRGLQLVSYIKDKVEGLFW
ncbi:CRISPR-associated helicase Cas3' [Aliarcobacter butzleri]|uniref:CRISPR-associated helicase Cas3' n=1 Tax=Aliarcobacter butzleri TaxID=28197 RepID=UPI000F470751|nr:CRISPR-associated helicase Cas3' [Aliarcobacter butzleri]MCG3653408.1 CRISPR-associated helicase Cas3' [Aliarcobacter butzleri]MCT7589762.1 CRISPR-associated helicase Cas3' [Aliarcobacter butzleri]